MSLKNIEKVLYFESYVVIDPGKTPLKKGEVLTEARSRKTVEERRQIYADIGSEAVRKMLKAIDVN